MDDTRLGDIRHTTVTGEYIYDFVVGKDGSKYAVSTVRMLEQRRGREYQTTTFLATEEGEPRIDYPIRSTYSTDWDKAKSAHGDHMELARR